MISLTQEIKRMLNALAFADAGEHLTLRQKTEYLDAKPGARDAIPPTTRAPVEAAPERRQVALYMGSELPADMMHYVIQTCSRLNHGLTVLTFQSESAAHALLDPYAAELEAAGIRMKIVLLTGEPVTGLARYLRRHPEVAFLACKETGYLGRSFLNGTQRQDILPVPVVLVATHDEHARKDAATASRDVPDSARAA